MSYLIACLLFALVPALLVEIDRKIKGTGSIIRKIGSFLFVSGLLFATLYFYGEAVMNSFNVNLKSFSNTKAFLITKLLLAICVLLLFLVLVIKMIIYAVKVSNNCQSFFKKEKKTKIETISFEENEIPNIKTVFSDEYKNGEKTSDKITSLFFAFNNEKEVLA